MEQYPRFSAERYVDAEAECLCHFVYGSNDFFNPHSHDYFEIFLTVSGSVTHWVNDSTFILPEGSLVFIRPEDTHGYVYESVDSHKTAYVNRTFTKETASQLFSYLAEAFPTEAFLKAENPPTVLLTHAEKELLLSQFTELYAVAWQDKKKLKMHMRVLLADIFLRFFANYKIADQGEMPIWFSHLLTEMKKTENFLQGTARMVELSRKSPEHLSRSFKKYVNQTPSEYINDLRINYAANLLINTNASILDICFDSGFFNVSHFYRTFKNKQGLSPGAFRNRYKTYSRTNNL